jgi:hypothetical protein
MDWEDTAMEEFFLYQEVTVHDEMDSEDISQQHYTAYEGTEDAHFSSVKSIYG